MRWWIAVASMVILGCGLCLADAPKLGKGAMIEVDGTPIDIEIGHLVPANFKFGIIVAIAIFWAEFLRSLLDGLFSLLNINSPILSNLILALAVSALGYAVLIGYRKIKSRLSKIKI